MTTVQPTVHLEAPPAPVNPDEKAGAVELAAPEPAALCGTKGAKLSADRDVVTCPVCLAMSAASITTSEPAAELDAPSEPA